MNVKKIGESIRHLRVKEGLTQQDIADYLGISFQAVSKWERGICVPDAAYLAKLAERLNVELADLLEGDITYLNDEWEGVLCLPQCDWLTVGEKPVIEIVLSYFMLAGIRSITVQGHETQITQVKEYIDGKIEYKLHFRYIEDLRKYGDFSHNIMAVTEPIFLYGTNLTKYFWRAMTRKNGVSVLAMEKEKGCSIYEMSPKKQNLIKQSDVGNMQMFPVYFCPIEFWDDFLQGVDELTARGMLYAEPTARGLVSFPVMSLEDMQEVWRFIIQVEEMTGEKIYDLDEIAAARRLK